MTVKQPSVCTWTEGNYGISDGKVLALQTIKNVRDTNAQIRSHLLKVHMFLSSRIACIRRPQKNWGHDDRQSLNCMLFLFTFGCFIPFVGGCDGNLWECL